MPALVAVMATWLASVMAAALDTSMVPVLAAVMAAALVTLLFFFHTWLCNRPN